MHAWPPHASGSCQEAAPGADAQRQRGPRANYLVMESSIGVFSHSAAM